MKNTIIGIVIGVCITVTVLSVWLVLNIRGRISNLESFATQVVSIINQNSQQVKK